MSIRRLLGTTLLIALLTLGMSTLAYAEEEAEAPAPTTSDEAQPPVDTAPPTDTEEEGAEEGEESTG